MLKKIFSLLALASGSVLVFGQNQLPTLININAVKTTLGYTITYDLMDPENNACEVFIRASTDGGKTYNLKPILVNGDAGPGIQSGAGKRITIPISALQLPGGSNSVIFKIIADDGYRPTLQDIADRIDTNRILENFQAVYGNNSPANPAHYEETRNYIKNYYDQLGVVTELDTFFSNVPDTIGITRQGINIYATIPGMDKSDSTVLMTGHYDTVEDTPGADDNNMSVAVCMEAARVLKDFQFRNTLKFAQWDLEEIGLLGAYYYASSTKSLNTKAVVNFDGISLYSEEPGSQKVPTGFDVVFPAAYQKAEADSFRGNFITIITDLKSASLGARAVQVANEVTPALKYIDISCPDPNCLIATDLRRSDHAPFWDRGVPAIFFTASTEFRSDCYHQPCDTTISLPFSTKVIQLAASLMADKAGLIHATSGYSQELTTSINTYNKSEVLVSAPYPNPVEHSCFFELDIKEPGSIRIVITDLTGKTIDVVQTTVGTGKQTVAWTPSRTIPAGTYLSSVSLNNTLLGSFKLQVQIDANKLMHKH